ncbi:hypothetical protein [Methyloceanibacter sp.]|uniref:hypothetical protein n=1 Tax=Methyloceanibacter sp. TaxID=1965321 RepID=UPI002D6541CB|nr:hypothetical protein [Methyloceanibacter sp.]HZP08995.1 hypothetical protein [Methyloceanibacter sp.]
MAAVTEERELFAMKMSPKLVECTLSQFNAQALPENHPATAQFNELFGDHTFFLDRSGLNIVEPAEPAESGAETGVVVKIASWSDTSYTRLTPHPPEATDLVIVLKAA